MTIERLTEMMTAEINLLRQGREAAVQQALRRLTYEASSIHLGHNLGSTANEISEYDAKIAEAEKVLFTIKEGK